MESLNLFASVAYSVRGGVAEDQETGAPSHLSATSEYQRVLDEQRDIYLDHYSKLAESLPVSVYRHYDALGELLYVGIASSPFSRDQQHVDGSRWRHRSHLLRIEVFPWRSMALAVEGCAIRYENPTHNKDRKSACGIYGKEELRFAKRCKGRMIGHTHWVIPEKSRPLFGPWGQD